MTHDEMIEAVAKAICEADKPNYEKRERWPIIGTVLQAQFKGIARAAIRVIAPAAERALRERDQAVEALIDVGASLAAAISLLERSRKLAMKAAPSNLMFDQMLADYRASLSRARATLASIEGAGNE